MNCFMNCVIAIEKNCKGMDSVFGFAYLLTKIKKLQTKIYILMVQYVRLNLDLSKFVAL